MRKILTYIFLLASICASASTLDEAKAQYKKGNFEQAVSILKPLAKKSPRDGNINYWLGASLVALNRNHEAIAPLEKAEGRGVADAALLLARIARDDYRPEDARDYYDSYEELLSKRKSKTKSEGEDIENELSSLVLMENMLERVEKVAVIDSMIVDAEGFFKHYRLSPDAGRIVEGESVGLPYVEMAFIPNNNTEILYSDPDSTEMFRLHAAGILDDGSVDKPHELKGEDLGKGGNAEFPFMLNDGMTLYYASDGEESLGGYDIFLTRRNEDGEFLQGQNVGMPYNSPYDDYMMAIDETTGLGWWATDRNQIPGKLTIYVFVPEDTRVNVSQDDPNLRNIARLSDISLTREAGKQYPEIPTSGQFAKNHKSDKSSTHEFELAVGSTNKIYTKLKDFRSPAAKTAMRSAINAQAQIENLQEKLTKLREAYHNGNHNVGNEIKSLERDLEQSRQAQKMYTNKAVKAELNL